MCDEILIDKVQSNVWPNTSHASRIEANLPRSLMLPSVAFRDAWGNVIAIPLQICQDFGVRNSTRYSHSIDIANVLCSQSLHMFIGILLAESPGSGGLTHGSMPL